MKKERKIKKEIDQLYKSNERKKKRMRKRDRKKENPHVLAIPIIGNFSDSFQTSVSNPSDIILSAL